jgi:hypothetical protein
MSESTQAAVKRKGGARVGAGRPSMWGTKNMTVPLPLVDGIERIIEEYKKVYKEMKSK